LLTLQSFVYQTRENGFCWLLTGGAKKITPSKVWILENILFYICAKFLLQHHINMQKNLVIVESPAKAKTIEKFLGKDFQVKSSFGHVRDLAKKDLGVEIEKGFKPVYQVSPDKAKIVQELKKLAKEAELVWLASDEDREGEAIAWHLAEALKLTPEKTRRIVFHEITKPAITQAIENPRSIDQNLVNAQQARRVLDRLVGFELSPLLWKKVKPSLSAGRVQSVAVRLIVERENEIKNFVSTSAFRVTAIFLPEGKSDKSFKAELPHRFKTAEEAEAFVSLCKNASFTIESIEKKPAKRSPAPPFTTSTLQQEAGRKLGYSVSKTMTVAQQLYESGKITYMRTDSLSLSKLAIAKAKEVIDGNYGKDYSKTRQFKTKTKGAQEAHEAIRPTYLENSNIDGDASQKRLYDLIWKRTIASQMSDALLEKTTITIDISGSQHTFVAKGEVITFDGFLKVYQESTDDENEEQRASDRLPSLTVGDKLLAEEITALERFSLHPPRYTEASLVKKMEELGIGRPSTYAPTISTIQKREYVVKEDRDGVERNLTEITLKAGKVKTGIKVEKSGYEKNKLFPTDLGSVVNDFLIKFFTDILDYNFTAGVEKEFDLIAEGKNVWNEMIGEFYESFHTKVEETTEKSGKFSGERLLGQDPESGKNVFVKIGRYGPMAQIGDTESEEKPRFAGLRKNQSLETITLEEALELFSFPKSIGSFEDEEVTVAIGRFGPYVKHKGAFFSIPKGEEPSEVALERAIEIIEEKRKKDREKTIKTFPEKPGLLVLNGRYGPYISYEKKNFRIPKSTDPKKLTVEDCEKIIESSAKTKSKKTGSKTKKR
jgi:DNA topoisomerase-1